MGVIKRAVALIATLDTKGAEAEYIRRRLEGLGLGVVVIDVSMKGDPKVSKPDVTSREVAEAASMSIDRIRAMHRHEAVEAMALGLQRICSKLYESGRIAGAIGIGGADGAIVAGSGMRALPLGIAKVLITPAMGLAEPLADTKDLVLYHSVADVTGLNALTRRIFDNAASALAGMMKGSAGALEPRGLIGATMFGHTTPAVMAAKEGLERKGYEVAIFAPGFKSGKAMEELLERGAFKAILDMTVKDYGDEMFGGVHRESGLRRLKLAAEMGIPILLSPGCANFIALRVEPGREFRLPRRFKGRGYVRFNPAFVHVRASKEEMEKLGHAIAAILNRAKGPAVVLFPLRGLSMYDSPGEGLHDPEGDRALLGALRSRLAPSVRLVELDAHINDAYVANAAVEHLTSMLDRMR
ncbi:MAG: Tm-1-like ATP-binding domain-containing protein [Candidatus Bathyarchaeia archaeon]